MMGRSLDWLLAEGWTPPPREFFSEETGLTPGYILTWIVGVVGVGMIAWIVAWLVERREQVPVHDNPKALFGELCAAHGLDRSARRLMIDLAQRQGLDNPARLFLRPESFTPVALDRAFVNVASDHRAAADALGRRLFGDEMPNSQARDASLAAIGH
jgi:hypothetical protein